MKNNFEREITFLKELHQASQMGKETLEHINKNIKSDELKLAVSKDIENYEDICCQINDKLNKRNKEPKSISKLPKMMAGMMIDMKVNENTDDSEVAKMIIDGTTKGVTECTAKISSFSDLDNDLLNIGYKFLWIQQKNIDEMKRFLHK